MKADILAALSFLLSVSRCFLPPGATGNGWTQTLDLGMLQKGFCHCATAEEKQGSLRYFAIFSLLVPLTMAGLKPLTLG